MTAFVRTAGREVYTIGLHRPEKLNALTQRMLDEIATALDDALASDVRVVVLLGEGRSFCSGADVTESLSLTDVPAAATFLGAIAGVLRRISNLPKPVIAGIKGHTAGGGAEIALEADIRVAGDDTLLWLPDVSIGSSPTSLYHFVRMLGTSRATRMAMLGERLSAEEMERLGLVASIVPSGEVEAAAYEIAERLRKLSPLSLRYAKEAVRLATEASRDADLAANIAAMLLCSQSEEQKRAVERFGQRHAKGHRDERSS